MKARIFGVLAISTCLLTAATGGAFTLVTNTREVPTQSVDQARDGGLSEAFASLRIFRLAEVFDELLSMPPPGALGGPRTDLSWRAMIDFAYGRQAFVRAFDEKTGLGPGYNEKSCAGCHSTPTIGGRGPDMRFGVFTIAPPEDPKDTVGTQKHAIAGHQPFVPKATTPARRTPPLYGIGLLDSVPDTTLLAIADPTDANKDGISGVLNERGHPAGGVRPARFGHKSNEPNLLRFIGAALFGEMGITNRASRARPKDKDKVKDPEAPVGYVAAVDAFVRGLAPPPRGPTNAQTARGRRVFQTLGCVGCHRPTLGKVAGAFTDLLIHDLGPANSDGLFDGKAGPTHWRTPALWGLRHKQRFLHDERATSIDAVLAFHGGEAAKAAGRYRQLSKSDQSAIKAFLQSL